MIKKGLLKIGLYIVLASGLITGGIKNFSQVNASEQNNIIKICGDKKVEKIECIKTKLVQKEGETRLSPVNIEGSNFFLLADYVIMAVGSKPEENLLAKLNLELDKKGRIKIDENNMTSQKGVFAGGDLAGTKATVAWASRSGRDAGNAIIKYLEKN